MTSTRNPGNTSEERLPPAVLRILREVSRLLDEGHADKAQPLLAGAIVLAPSHISVLRLEAAVHIQLRAYREALKVLATITLRHPRDAASLSAMSNAQAGMGRIDLAIETLRRLCEISPEPAHWIELGLMHDRHGDHQQALDVAERVLEMNPAHAQAALLRARSLQALGRIAETAQQFRELIARTDSARAWFGLVDIKTIRLGADELARLEKAARKQGYREDESICIDFALGRALEDAGEYARAFSVLRRANDKAARRESWSAAAHQALTKAIAHAFADEASPQVDGARGSEVIFVCGLPRSGSTLVEQILAAHSSVEGASELPDLAALLAEESNRRMIPFETWAGSATDQDWARLGEEYLRRTERWRINKPVSTDKALENWKFVGAIRRMLPGSRIIDCRRDAVETCWSCYKQLFAPGLVSYSYRFEDLVAYWNDYQTLSSVWFSLHPHHFRVQRYESIVADPDREIPELLEFCGLAYEEQCLTFQNARRSVRTASSAQVREPLAAPLIRQQAYAGLLEGLREMLNPTT
ncbi:MAG: sulfotransferase [Xanthomonadales bacterium]|nr:sulfotransferase [Xanthomonadales bacterium]